MEILFVYHSKIHIIDAIKLTALGFFVLSLQSVGKV